MKTMLKLYIVLASTKITLLSDNSTNEQFKLIPMSFKRYTNSPSRAAYFSPH